MFDKNGFMQYVSEHFNLDRYSSDLVENLIDYGLHECDSSEGQFIGFLWRILPEISEEEIKQFYEEE